MKHRSAFSSLLRYYFPFEATLSILICLIFLGTYVWSEPTSKSDNVLSLVTGATIVRWIWWSWYLRYLAWPIDRFVRLPSHSRFDLNIVRPAHLASQSVPIRFASWNFFAAITQWMGTVVMCDALGWFGDRSPSFVASGLIWAAAPAAGGFIFSFVVLRVILAPYAEEVGNVANVMELGEVTYRSSLRNEIIWFSISLTFAPVAAFVAHGLQTDLERQWAISRLQVQNDAMRFLVSTQQEGESFRIEFDAEYSPTNLPARNFSKDFPRLHEAFKRGAQSAEHRRFGVVATVLPTRTGYIGAVLKRPVSVPNGYILNVLLMLVAIGIWAPWCGIFMSATMKRSLVRILTALRSVRTEDLARYNRVPIADTNEIGDLSVVANDMLTRLETSEEAISEVLFQLKKKNAKLADSFSAKSHFIANMSHELRTPLNAIIGFSRMTIRRADQGTIEKVALVKNMQIIQRSGEHLLSLVNDLLDFEKIEAGAMQVSNEKVVLFESIHSVVETLELAAEEKGLSILVEPIDPKLVVMSDNERFRQILTNLVNNAIKYSDDGQITVRADASKKYVDISVADEGIGIPIARQASIFEPFRQAEEEISRTRDGAGLGLAIVSRLCDLLNSTIRVDSEPGVGSTFILTVPRIDVRRTEPSISFIDESE